MERRPDFSGHQRQEAGQLHERSLSTASQSPRSQSEHHRRWLRVNQILPILVRILRRGTPSGFLIQQPEVHLHPKGQAELASLLIALSQKLKHSFVVETHSDYMIDRARIEIRKGNIRPEDVSLIYLEPKQRSVKAHNISFDRMGNLMGTPNHYGEFFLKETDRLLGFED